MVKILTLNSNELKKIKHINVRIYFIRNVIAHNTIVVKKIPTMDNLANMMTKLFLIVKVRHCLNLISVDSI